MPHLINLLLLKLHQIIWSELLNLIGSQKSWLWSLIGIDLGMLRLLLLVVLNNDLRFRVVVWRLGRRRKQIGVAVFVFGFRNGGGSGGWLRGWRVWLEVLLTIGLYRALKRFKYLIFYNGKNCIRIGRNLEKSKRKTANQKQDEYLKNIVNINLYWQN